MPKRQTSVPSVPRHGKGRRRAQTDYGQRGETDRLRNSPTWFHSALPPPGDDDPIENLDMIAFGMEWVTAMAILFIVVISFAVFVIEPIVHFVWMM